MHDDIVRHNLRSNLIKLRKTNNMTQQDVAELIGVERSTYTSWEAGRSLPKPAQFIMLSKIYKVSFEFLTGSELNKDLWVSGDEGKQKRVYGDNFVSELNDYERTVILKVRMLNAKDRRAVEDYLDEIREKDKELTIIDI